MVKRIVIVFFATVVAAVAQTSPTPHAGWKLAAGGRNLLVNGFWDNTTEGPSPVTVQVSGGVVTAAAQSGNYLGAANVLAPYLITSGDFGVVATFQNAPGTDGLITLTGSLNTGAQYWQGNSYLEFGVDNNGNYVFAYWNGTSSSPTSYQVLRTFSTAQTGPMTVELLRQSGQFSVYFNGAQYGPFADPGLFGMGYVIPGFTLFPGQRMMLTQFAFEVPSSATTAQVYTPMGTIPFVHPGDSLGSLAALNGRLFGLGENAFEFANGSRYNNPGATSGLPDLSFQPKVVGEFNLVTAATMYYFNTETAQGDFTFGDGDAVIAMAQANGMQAHCHHLIGPNIYLPSWLTAGKFNSAQLTQILTTHVTSVVSHFKGRCASWDVVNEALNADGTVNTSASNIWGNVIGPSYIDLAFQAARQADPDAKLYYNEYSVENQTAKTTGLYTLLTGMQSRGTPIDGVGLQCHWNPQFTDLNSQPQLSSMTANMAQLAKMGLIARISELDARLQLPATQSELAAQATVFGTTVQACLSSPNCVSITQWDANDGDSWIPSQFPGYGAATMFDANYTPKAAYTSVMNTLRSASQGVATAPAVAASGIVNAASYAGGGVAPGEIVTIFANNAGPAALTRTSLDASGKVVTEIAGTRVLFDGIAAPMVYAAKNQLAVVVPYEIAGEASTLAQVEYNGLISVAATVPVMTAIPGIITTNSQGTGQAVAVNQDGTLNSAGNPAARGSIVTIYATGEGQRTPPGVTGVPAPANGVPAAGASLTVGGVGAALAYAASAPGFVGLMQTNFTVPASAGVGGAVPVVLKIGSAASPAVTIAVK